MKKTLAAGAVSVAVVLALAACGDSDDTTAETTTATTSVGAEATTGEHGAHDGDSSAHNEADVAFTRGMIPHHEQAVEMSDVILAKDGIDPRVTALAEQIRAAQAPEIETLTGWLTDWGVAGTDDSTGGHEGHDMDGMMSEQDMRALEQAEGTEAARLFLTQMIVHHEGAVAMADTEIQEGEFPDAVEMARTIAQTQQQEITAMEELLATL
ncbi:DUF305 domain-containing protein [Rhodococcus triatomae]|uniref:Uncharacterized conserved protein, DUF305 family n=1 Tax=Rhodococcus triatomae TaxID=300028 RepID=A0A1G8QIV2_9NOCA|nr:DUF305 domain-containing protein [Rhodococcus triatomae]QNG20658.1 DUF305 domain-containing protein [Rhodococcus triatomae]QNG23424.1 DUF305 domain-containing protein [Rhodococcus triatomae]SDJ04662.1 Uncharacterized conserved protein, DUF305 family [Rhodococcus triatomae]